MTFIRKQRFVYPLTKNYLSSFFSFRYQKTKLMAQEVRWLHDRVSRISGTIEYQYNRLS